MTPSAPDADALLVRADQLRRTGRAQEAAQAYRQLLAIRPDLPDSWFNLGLMERRSGRFQAALEAYGEALRRALTDPQDAWLDRAAIWADELGRYDLAVADLERALALAPDWPPALLNLGAAHEAMGRRDAARQTYDRVLAVSPSHAIALARVAGLTQPSGPDEPIIEILRAVLAQPDVRPADQAELGFALGRALDACGACDEAFAAYGAANAASRASDPQPVVYDRAAHARLVDRLIAVFPEPATPSAGTEKSPVFICGMFRSGSTLVEQILAGHSRVTGGGELGLVPALAQMLTPYPEAVARLDAATIDALRARYLQVLEDARPGADIVTDKRPDNFLHIGLIRTMFPDARIVHTVRDPLDTILSNWFLHLDRSLPHALDLDDLVHWHGQYQRLMSHWKQLYPDIIEVDYDRLVVEPRPVIEDLLACLGLDWEDGVLDFHRADTGVRTASVWQVREPLYRHASGRWRNYAKHLEGVRAALGV